MAVSYLPVLGDKSVEEDGHENPTVIRPGALPSSSSKRLQVL